MSINHYLRNKCYMLYACKHDLSGGVLQSIRVERQSWEGVHPLLDSFNALRRLRPVFFTFFNNTSCPEIRLIQWNRLISRYKFLFESRKTWLPDRAWDSYTEKNYRYLLPCKQFGVQHNEWYPQQWGTIFYDTKYHLVVPWKIIPQILYLKYKY